MADGAEQHRVERAYRTELVGREPLAGLQEMRARPREPRAFGAKSEALLARVEHLERRLGDLRADAIARDDAEPVRVHAR